MLKVSNSLPDVDIKSCYAAGILNQILHIFYPHKSTCFHSLPWQLNNNSIFTYYPRISLCLFLFLSLSFPFSFSLSLFLPLSLSSSYFLFLSLCFSCVSPFNRFLAIQSDCILPNRTYVCISLAVFHSIHFPFNSNQNGAN